MEGLYMKLHEKSDLCSIGDSRSRDLGTSTKKHENMALFRYDPKLCQQLDILLCPPRYIVPK